jgi:hypothetical protein
MHGRNDRASVFHRSLVPLNASTMQMQVEPKMPSGLGLKPEGQHKWAGQTRSYSLPPIEKNVGDLV